MNKKVKPLILKFNTEQEIANYYFNREFNQHDLEKVKNSEGCYDIVNPSDKILIEEWLSEGYVDEEEIKKEYRDNVGRYDKYYFYDWISESSRDFEDYKYGDFQQNHYPMWGYVWEAPEFYINSNYMDVDKLYKLGIGVIECDDSYYLFIAGAGYDFYNAHWIPLFRKLGWIEYENN